LFISATVTQIDSATMGNWLQKVTPMTAIGQVDNPEDLPAKLVIDQNVVICQAAPNPSGNTVVVIVTPGDALARHLHVTTNSNFARVMRCGEGMNGGQPMKAPNQGMRMVAVDFGKDAVVAIQFLKERKSSCLCFEHKPDDYGTLLIPKALKGHLIVFFWPDNYIGVGYGNFPLKRSEVITIEEGKIKYVEIDEKISCPRCLIKNDDEAAQLRAIFGL